MSKKKSPKGHWVVAILAAPEGYKGRLRRQSSDHLTVVHQPFFTGWKDRLVASPYHRLPCANRTVLERIEPVVVAYVKIRGRESWAANRVDDVENALENLFDPMFPHYYRAEPKDAISALNKSLARAEKRRKRQKKNARIGKLRVFVK